MRALPAEIIRDIAKAHRAPGARDNLLLRWRGGA